MSLHTTWHGYVADITDVEKIVHACVEGLLVDMPRRLDEQEREELIQHGAVFVFEEGKSGMMRWVDHLKVSNSTVERWHLVAYYNREYRTLPRVSNDPILKSVTMPFKMYANNSSRNRSGTGELFGGSSKSPPESVRAATPAPQPYTKLFPGHPTTQAQPAPLPSYAQSQTQQQPRPNLFGRSGLPSASNTANARRPPLQTNPPAQPQTQPSRPLLGGMRASTPPPQAARPPAPPPSSGGLFGRRAPSPGPQTQQQPQQARGMFGMRAPSPQPTQSQPLRSASPVSSSRSSWGRSSNPSPSSRTSSEYNHSHYQPDDMMDIDREMGGLDIGIQRPSTGMGMGRPRLPSVTGMSGMSGLGSYQRARRMSVNMRGPDDTEYDVTSANERNEMTQKAWAAYPVQKGITDQPTQSTFGLTSTNDEPPQNSVARTLCASTS
ncbi:hypothetical protein BT69DRAFT_1320637 [Atractiella rhizophila]|nr:hypothetical protein BT69DRAFT_1320637 [Atractiella rhizophila]